MGFIISASAPPLLDNTKPIRILETEIFNLENWSTSCSQVFTTLPKNEVEEIKNGEMTEGMGYEYHCQLTNRDIIDFHVDDHPTFLDRVSSICLETEKRVSYMLQCVLHVVADSYNVKTCLTA